MMQCLSYCHVFRNHAHCRQCIPSLISPLIVCTGCRQGYEEMASRYGLTHLQRVRGDNYCAVRAALYQLLAKGLPPPNANRCRRLLDSVGDWVTAWSFGSRLPYDVTTARAGIQDCLNTLSQLVRTAEGRACTFAVVAVDL